MLVCNKISIIESLSAMRVTVSGGSPGSERIRRWHLARLKAGSELVGAGFAGAGSRVRMSSGGAWRGPVVQHAPAFLVVFRSFALSFPRTTHTRLPELLIRA